MTMERDGNSRIAWAVVSWVLDNLSLALVYPAGVMTWAAQRLRVAAGYASRKAFP